MSAEKLINQYMAAALIREHFNLENKHDLVFTVEEVQKILKSITEDMEAIVKSVNSMAS